MPAGWPGHGPRRGLRLGHPRGRRGALGAARVVGVDTDPIAVEATIANAAPNHVARAVQAREGTLPTAGGPFDVVLANLIAGLLVRLAAELSQTN